MAARWPPRHWSSHVPASALAPASGAQPEMHATSAPHSGSAKHVFTSVQQLPAAHALQPAPPSVAPGTSLHATPVSSFVLPESRGALASVPSNDRDVDAHPARATIAIATSERIS